MRAHIDDLLVIASGSFGDHLEKLRTVPEQLNEAGLKVNIKKSFFAKSEPEHLGCWIVRKGTAPLAKKSKPCKS